MRSSAGTSGGSVALPRRLAAQAAMRAQIGMEHTALLGNSRISGKGGRYESPHRTP